MISVVGKAEYKEGQLVMPTVRKSWLAAHRNLDKFSYRKNGKRLCKSCDGDLQTMPKANCRQPMHMERWQARQKYLHDSRKVTH